MHTVMLNHLQKSFIGKLSSQKGAGLIEMMVSLLILGVGLLGVLSLQVNGSTSNQRAVFLTEAQVLAQDMADRIRAYGNDGLGARGGEYGGTATGTIRGPQAYAEQQCNNASACDPDQVVAFDRHEWEKALDESSLPSGEGRVIFNDAINEYTVRILWDQDRTGANQVIPDNQSCFNFANATQKGTNGFLTCYDIIVSTYRD